MILIKQIENFLKILWRFRLYSGGIMKVFRKRVEFWRNEVTRVRRDPEWRSDEGVVVKSSEMWGRRRVFGNGRENSPRVAPRAGGNFLDHFRKLDDWRTSTNSSGDTWGTTELRVSPNSGGWVPSEWGLFRKLLWFPGVYSNFPRNEDYPFILYKILQIKLRFYINSSQ